MIIEQKHQLERALEQKDAEIQKTLLTLQLERERLDRDKEKAAWEREQDRLKEDNKRELTNQKTLLELEKKIAVLEATKIQAPQPHYHHSGCGCCHSYHGKLTFLAKRFSLFFSLCLRS